MLGRAALKRYTVHHKEGAEDSTLFIREGFSVWAFLLGFIWLFYHRAWAPALLTFAVALLLRFLEVNGYASELTLSVISLGMQYWIGCDARDWQREALERRGWRFSDIVVEESEERAEMRYFERHVMIGAGIHQTTPDAA